MTSNPPEHLQTEVLVMQHQYVKLQFFLSKILLARGSKLSSLTSFDIWTWIGHMSLRSLTCEQSQPQTKGLVKNKKPTQQGSRLCVTHSLVLSMFHSCVRPDTCPTLFQYTCVVHKSNPSVKYIPPESVPLYAR